MEERLNKVIARAGITSRRGADELIANGRIRVNGKVITKLGTKVDPKRDEIRFDDERINLKEGKKRYLAFYKPRHVITTLSDPFGRPTIMDFVEPDVRLFPIGRLDGNSEGLLILTNDGDLANQLTHPRYEHEKEYRVKISGTPLETSLKAWREGVWLPEGRTLPAKVTIESSTGGGTWLRFVLREGKNRQIRRMIEPFKHTIHKLIRLRMGPIVLGRLKPGQSRELNQQELAALHAGSNEPLYHAAARQSGKTKKKAQYKKGWARAKAKAKLGNRSGNSSRRKKGSAKGKRKVKR
jgi:23S rRNA pseudouridine2605 synthase